ncbi:MAG: glycosyltransferase 87 family protein, partial [Pirellulales bacterium]
QIVLATLLLAFAMMLWLEPLVVLPTYRCVMQVVQISHTLLLAVAAMLFLGVGSSKPWSSRSLVSLAAIGWVALIASRVLTIIAAPSPEIDVFVTNTLACDYFLAGQNPYAAWYPDQYDGRYGYAPGFFYWPAYLYWAAPFRALFGDVRYAAIAADAFTAALLVRIGRQLDLDQPTRMLIPLVWLAQPVSLLVIELGWIDPVLVLGIAATACCILSGRFAWAGVALGVVAATKQYGLLVACLTVPYLIAAHREAAKRVAVAVAATAGALVLPWLLLDSTSFLERTVTVYLTAPPRSDALSIVAWASDRLGVSLPGVLLIVSYALAVGFAVWRMLRTPAPSLADWAGAMAVTYCTIFLLGKQAFCNYYVLVAFLVLLAAMLSLADDRRRFPARKVLRVVRSDGSLADDAGSAPVPAAF